MIVSLIAAMSSNRVISSDGKLPWRLPADLRFFKRMTMGHTVVMGRKTFDSVGKALAGRINVVVTRQASWSHPGVLVAHSLDEALANRDDEEIFIIGGAEIYALALPRAQRIYLTVIEKVFAGDTYFPPFESPAWHLASDEPHEDDGQLGFSFRYRRYERRD